jgi:hypothetical protein
VRHGSKAEKLTGEQIWSASLSTADVVQISSQVGSGQQEKSQRFNRSPICDRKYGVWEDHAKLSKGLAVSHQT